MPTKQELLDWIKDGMTFKAIDIKSKKVKGLSVQLSWDCSEGIQGDYNFQDADDVPLLRFDVSMKTKKGHEDLQDSSFCTQLCALDDRKLLEKAVACILKEAEQNCKLKKDDTFEYHWKRIMEGFSWLCIEEGRLK
jgi:hypothetical protein